MVGGGIALSSSVGCIVVNGAALAPLLVEYWGSVFVVGGIVFSSLVVCVGRGCRGCHGIITTNVNTS